MCSNKVEFDTYRAIAPLNVNSDDHSVVRAIKMGLIVVEVLVNGEIKRICIKKILHMPKL